MINKIFISYAGEDKAMAKYISDEVNKQIGYSFFCQLVEDRKEGDTTFTENIVKYFRDCNIFIVLLTRNSIINQFVNQEWGYAKALKELGQIQLIQHIVERNLNVIVKDVDKSKENFISYGGDGRLISEGFIATNMMLIDLEIKDDIYNIEECTSEIISLLKERESTLIPIATERQQKLMRFINENDHNIEIVTNLINSKDDFRLKGNLAPDQISYDYALQIISIGHSFNNEFINFLEDYIMRCKKMNAWKDLQMQWIISRKGLHEGNVKRYFLLLDDFYEISQKMRNELIKLKDKYLI